MPDVLPFSPRPRFENIVEALGWFTRTGVAVSKTEPPVDAAGDQYVDTYLATVFTALRHFDGLPLKIAHLNDKASREDRQCLAVLSAAGDHGDTEYEAHKAEAEVHRTLCNTMRRWAQAFADAGAERVVGGAA